MTREEYKSALEIAKFCRKGNYISKKRIENLIEELHVEYDGLRENETYLQEVNHNILEYEIRLGVEHPEICICKNCKYFHELKELVNKQWVVRSCCTLLAEKEEDGFKDPVIVCREDDRCEEFKLRAGGNDATQ